MDTKQISALNKLNNELVDVYNNPLKRREFLYVLPFLVSGCANVAKTRYREGDNRGQSTSMTVADEQNMTKNYLPKMMKEYPLTQDSYVQGYVKELGQEIVRDNKLNGKPYTYSTQAVDAKMINAFALPAGKMFVTTPLLLAAESEAELAGVIGHEIGHIKARHTAERIDKAKKEESKGFLYALGGALLGGAAGYGLGKLLCSKNDRECNARILKYGAMAGSAGGLLIQKFGFMANSREDEMEADRIGFRTSVASGYSKYHVGKFYEKLLEMEKQHKKSNKGIMSAFSDALSTHPPSQERVNQMRILIQQEPKSSGRVTSREFKKMQKRLKRS